MLYTVKINNVTLADGSAAICESIIVNGSQIIDEAHPLRSTWVALFDRGNKASDLVIRISTAHDSLAMALDWRLRRIEGLPGIADLTITFTEGETTYTAIARGAAWKTVSSDQIGYTTRETYSVRCAGITTTGAPIGLGIPTVPESSIDPLVIPSGTTAEVNSGEVLCAFEIDIEGELDLAATGQIFLLTH